MLEEDLKTDLIAENDARRRAELLARHPVPQKAPEQSSLLDKAGAVAKDVGAGLTFELPKAIAGGARDAVQETIDFGAGLDKATADALGFLPGLQFKNPETGELDVRLVNLANEAREDIGVTLPDVPDPESNTGKLIEGFAQFLTGFAGAGKALKAGSVLQGAGAASTVTRGAVQGAIADFAVFDPQEERLANLIEQVPGLSNPVTQYLSAQEDDGEIEGRLKNVLEGAGVGIPVDLFAQGLRTLRSARTARKTLEDIDAIPVETLAAQVNGEKIVADLTETLGDRQAPRFSTKVKEAAAKKAGGDAGIFVNFARIDTDKDVRDVIGKMTRAYSDDINAARGGERVSVARQKLSAEQIDAFDVIAARRQGEPLNAAQTLAVRDLWATSAAKLKEVSAVAAANPSEGNLLAFRKMMATHHAIQREVIAARTETARALQIWNVPAGESAELAREIESILTQTGGNATHRKLAVQAAQIAEIGSRELDEFVERGATATTPEAVAEVYRFALLSSPQTHVVNAMGNTLTMLNELAERSTASRLASVLGRQADSVANGETAAMASGMLAGFHDSLRYASKALRGKNPTKADFGIFDSAFGKTDAPRRHAVSAATFGQEGSAMGPAIDALGAVIRAPQSALGGADTFFKTVNWRGELYAQAYRKVAAEVRLGQLSKDDVAKRTAELLNNPSDAMLDAARLSAETRTFTNPPAPGGVTAGILQFRNGLNAGPLPLGHILLPFVSTPANIMRYAFQRTPLAPLFREFRADFAAGGARQELAVTRMAAGTMIMAAASDMAMNGVISGGGPAEGRQRQNLIRAGWQPYSVRVGDRWFAYNRLDPLGMTLGLGADLAEIFANTDWTEQKSETIGEAVALSAGSLATNVLNKSYLTGLADFFEFSSDPERYGEGYLTRLAGTFAVPNVAASVRRIEDPFARDVTSVMDGIRNRVPGLSKDLPLRRDLWGDPIEYQSGLGTIYDALSPIYTRKDSEHPIDHEIVRLGVDQAMPRRSLSVGGVNVSLRNRPEIYQRYVELAGNELKIGGMGARDRLNAIVTGRDTLSETYERGSEGPEGGKAEIIKKVISTYRRAATLQVRSEFPELERLADEQRVDLLK